LEGSKYGVKVKVNMVNKDVMSGITDIREDFHPHPEYLLYLSVFIIKLCYNEENVESARMPATFLRLLLSR